MDINKKDKIFRAIDSIYVAKKRYCIFRFIYAYNDKSDLTYTEIINGSVIYPGNDKRPLLFYRYKADIIRAIKKNNGA